MKTESEPRRPADRSLQTLIEVEGRIRPDDPGLEAWVAKYRREHRNRLAFDLEIVARHLEPGATILEYGAVPLSTTAALVELGYAVTGLDVAPERFASTIEDNHLTVVRCDVENETVPFADRSFEAILFNELFEHLRISPIFTLREAWRVLEPQGLLLLSTPNLRSLRGLRNLAIDGRGHASSGGIFEQYEKIDTLGHMGHVREYTQREVSEFLERIGFQTEVRIFRGGHGRGLAGVAERLLPQLRPFFTIVARKVSGSPSPIDDSPSPSGQG